MCVALVVAVMSKAYGHCDLFLAMHVCSSVWEAIDLCAYVRA
jgi:hypothetical protein